MTQTVKREFRTGDRVVFRESETGPAEMGTVRFELEPTESHPNGGEYDIDLDDGTPVTAYWTELDTDYSRDDDERHPDNEPELPPFFGKPIDTPTGHKWMGYTA